MMPDLYDQFRTRTADALRSVARRVEAAGPSAWRFELPEAEAAQATAELVPDWLLLRQTLANGTSRDWRDPVLWGHLLCLNDGLEGGAKFCIDGQGRGLSLAAEIPLAQDAEAALQSRLAAACDGLGCGVRRIAAGPAMGQTEPRAAVSPQAAEALAPLCEQSGWGFERRPSGQWAVRLEVPDAFFQAQLEPTAAGGARLVLCHALADAPEDGCRRAVELMLLLASATVRMVRPAATATPEGLAYCWEVPWAGLPEGWEIARGVSALSVACGLAGREIRLLGEDPRLAREYLAAGGGSPA